MSIGLVVFIVFLVLKLTEQIGWSWLWVTSPIWIEFGFYGVALIVFLAVTVLFRRSVYKRNK